MFLISLKCLDINLISCPNAGKIDGYDYLKSTKEGKCASNASEVTAKNCTSHEGSNAYKVEAQVHSTEEMTPAVPPTATPSTASYVAPSFEGQEDGDRRELPREDGQQERQKVDLMKDSEAGLRDGNGRKGKDGNNGCAVNSKGDLMTTDKEEIELVEVSKSPEEGERKGEAGGDNMHCSDKSSLVGLIGESEFSEASI